MKRARVVFFAFCAETRLPPIFGYAFERREAPRCELVDVGRSSHGAAVDHLIDELLARPWISSAAARKCSNAFLAGRGRKSPPVQRATACPEAARSPIRIGGSAQASQTTWRQRALVELDADDSGSHRRRGG
jgi:hypothetical protein